MNINLNKKKLVIFALKRELARFDQSINFFVYFKLYSSILFNWEVILLF